MFLLGFFSLPDSSTSTLDERSLLRQDAVQSRAMNLYGLDEYLLAQILQWLLPRDVVSASLTTRQWYHRIRHAWRYIDVVMHDWYVHHLILQPQLNIELLASEHEQFTDLPPVEQRLFPSLSSRCSASFCNLCACTTSAENLNEAKDMLLVSLCCIAPTTTAIVSLYCIGWQTENIFYLLVAYDLALSLLAVRSVFSLNCLSLRLSVLQSIACRLQRHATELDHNAMAQLNEPLLIENYGALDNV